MPLKKTVKLIRITSCLASLMLIISALGFSGAVTQAVSQQQTGTEARLTGGSCSKIRSSFNRLRSVLISKSFFDALSQSDAVLFERNLTPALTTEFNQVSQISDSLITFAESIRFLHRARSFDNAIVLQG